MSRARHHRRARLHLLAAFGGIACVVASGVLMSACGAFLFDDDDTVVEEEGGVRRDSTVVLEATTVADGFVFVPATDSAIPCPPECTSCENGECVIVCVESDPDGGGPSCGSGVVCPAGVPCHIKCLGGGAPCGDRTLDCVAASSCLVDCLGDNACIRASVSCGNGRCALTCGASANACNQTKLDAVNAADVCMRCLEFPEACNGLRCQLGSGPCSRVCDPAAANACANEDQTCNHCTSLPTCPQ